MFINRLLFSSLLIFSSTAVAQIESIVPNCSFKFVLSNRTQDVADSGVFGQSIQSVYQLSAGAVTTAAIPNKDCGADLWTVRYVPEGLSALSIQFESSQLSRAPQLPSTNIVDTAISFSAFQGTTNVGNNPNTSTTSALSRFSGLYPFVRINLSSSTGTGSVTVYVDGWRSQQFFGVAVMPPTTNNVVTLAPPNTPQGFNSQFTVTNSATAISNGNNNVNLKSVCVGVLSSSTASAFIGFTSGVTTGNGFEIFPGTSLCTQAATNLAQIFAIAAANGTTTIDIWGYQ